MAAGESLSHSIIQDNLKQLSHSDSSKHECYNSVLTSIYKTLEGVKERTWKPPALFLQGPGRSEKSAAVLAFLLNPLLPSKVLLLGNPADRLANQCALTTLLL